MPFKSFGEAIQYAYGKAYSARQDVVVLLDWVSRRMWALVGPHKPYCKLRRHQEWFRVSAAGVVTEKGANRQDVLYLLVNKFISIEDAERLLG